MADLIQTDIIGTLDEYLVLPSYFELNTNPPHSFQVEGYANGPGGGARTMAQLWPSAINTAFRCDPDGAYNASGNYVRFTILDSTGDFRFSSGQRIQQYRGGGSRTVLSTPFEGIIVRNNKQFNYGNSAAGGGPWSGPASITIGGQSRPVGDLNDVVVRPITGSITDWLNMLPASGTGSPNNNRTISRPRTTYQPNYGNEIIVEGNLGLSNGSYSQGDGEDQRFMRDHRINIDNNGQMRMNNYSINFGYPEVTDDQAPMIDRSNWATRDGRMGSTEYISKTRTSIVADSLAQSDALQPMVQGGGVVNMIGCDIDVANEAGNQRVSFGLPPRAVGQGTGDGRVRIITDANRRGRAAVLEGGWVQDLTSAPSPTLSDFLSSGNYFGIPSSEFPTVQVLTSFVEVTTRHAVDIQYTRASTDAEGGLTEVVHIPAGTQLFINNYNNAGEHEIAVNFSPTNTAANPTALPAFSNVIDNTEQYSDRPIYMNQGITVGMFDSTIQFSKRDPSTMNARVDFETDVDVNGLTINYASAASATTTHLDGRALPLRFDNVRITDERENAAAGQLIIDNAPDTFSTTWRGLNARTVDVNGINTPAPSGNAQEVNLINPVRNVTKAYNQALTGVDQQFGRLNINRELIGDIANGKDDTNTLRVVAVNPGLGQFNYTIDSSGAITTAPVDLSGRMNTIHTYENGMDSEGILRIDEPGALQQRTGVHPYTFELPMYSVIPNTFPSGNPAAGLQQLQVNNYWRVAVTEIGCQPFVADVEIGGTMGGRVGPSETDRTSQVIAQLHPTLSRDRTRFNPEGIRSSDGGLGEVVLEIDPFVTQTEDASYFTDLMAYSNDDAPTSIQGIYDLLHLNMVNRHDGVRGGGEHAGIPFATVNSDRYIDFSTYQNEPYPSETNSVGKPINLSTVESLSSLYTPSTVNEALTPVAGKIIVDPGSISNPAPVEIRVLGDGNNIWSRHRASDGPNDVRGFQFDETLRGTVDASNSSWALSLRNGTLTNLPQVGAGSIVFGTFENTTFQFDGGTYVFDSCNFEGDLANIRLERVANPTGGVTEILFTNNTFPAGLSQADFTNADSMNIQFLDARTITFPAAGQVVMVRDDRTTNDGTIVNPDSTNRTTFDVSPNSPVTIEGSALSSQDQLLVYYKPHDRVTTVRGRQQRIRHHLTRHEFDWGSTAGTAYTIPDTAVQPLTSQEALGMGVDVYPSGGRTLVWSLESVPGPSANPGVPSQGALLNINLQTTGGTTPNNLSLGETKLFAYWLMDRHDRQANAQNHWLEAYAVRKLPVDRQNPENAGVPVHFLANEVVMRTDGLTIRASANAPLNSLQGMTVATYPNDPANQVRALQYSDARDDQGMPLPHASADAPPLDERELFIFRESRGLSAGFPDIATRLPQEGLTPAQVEDAALNAIRLSTANNILHWVADGQSSKIPVGRAYDPTTDYTDE